MLKENRDSWIDLFIRQKVGIESGWCRAKNSSERREWTENFKEKIEDYITNQPTDTVDENELAINNNPIRI